MHFLKMIKYKRYHLYELINPIYLYPYSQFSLDINFGFIACGGKNLRLEHSNDTRS